MTALISRVRRTPRLVAALAAFVTIGAVAPAVALAYNDSLCCYEITSGNSQAGGVVRSNAQYQTAYSRGTAFSGVWLALSDGTRVSAITYCESPGCQAAQGLGGNAGRTVMHNHGNASNSSFGGSLQYG